MVRKKLKGFGKATFGTVKFAAKETLFGQPKLVHSTKKQRQKFVKKKKKVQTSFLLGF